MTLDLSLITDEREVWDEIEESIKGKPFDLVKIKEAYEFASYARRGQKRRSGHNFITHIGWIAKIVGQLGAGEESVIAALLHDIVEDTVIKLEDISEKFGDEVALLVSGLTEVKVKTKGVGTSHTSLDSFRKFLFSSVNDVRILIIRLVDKLHNGLTINALTSDEQKNYARRVLGIYGPVAEYVGLHYFKRILEDIAFEILHKDEAREIKLMFEKSAEEALKADKEIKETVSNILKINNLKDFEIQSRIKSLYSTYQKISRIGVDKVKDRVGIRILVNTVQECYTVLGLLHSKFRYIEDEFDDYISAPKSNGYRSLQTTVFWSDVETAEIQIRTKEMHEFNEFGPASHIAYKLSKQINPGVGFEWVKELIKWQKTSNNINNYRINVLSNYVYVFTPKGDTIQIPKGSTALDFAYKIHTDVGDRCIGVKVNSKIEKLGVELKTGDQVEVLTGNKINVSKKWLGFVKSSLAREHIKKMTQY